MFHKENLWQLCANKVPAKFTKLVFIDGDIMVDDPMVWVSRLSAMLDTYQIIQPFSNIKFMDGKQSTIQPLVLASDSVRETPFAFDMAYPSPGYGIAVQRKWLTQIGGLVTRAIVGAGDLMMLGSLCAPEHVMNSLPYRKSPFMHYDIQRYINNTRKVKYGFAPHQGVHLFHGKRENRQYGSRHDAMETLQEDDLYINKYGVIEFKDLSWSSIMLKYFRGRKEDD
jgi:hypothetical protein